MNSLFEKITHTLSSYNQFRRTIRGWRKLKLKHDGVSAPARPPKRVVLVPPDPWTLVGSKGDEAMFSAVVARLRAAVDNLDVAVLTATGAASDAAASLGYRPLQVWHGKLGGVFSAVQEFSPDALIVFGADCMDGYYNPHTTLLMLALADLAARSGLQASIMGFSFNESPHPWLRKPFEMLSPSVALNVRDQVSLGRLRRFSAVDARLVADCAFMLQADTESETVQSTHAWVQKRKAQHHKVFGFNIHPMLLNPSRQSDLAEVIRGVARGLGAYLSKNQVSVVLICHDYREGGGGDVCLSPLFEMLGADHSEQVYYNKQSCSAAEVKGMVAPLDGVITGRMHLAIAALGMGVPVAAFSYQGKFEGLLQHFEMSSDLLLDVNELMNPAQLEMFLKRFEASAPLLRDQVRRKWPDVQKAAERNLDGVLAPT